jgi:hypothetical protein
MMLHIAVITANNGQSTYPVIVTIKIDGINRMKMKHENSMAI